MHKFEKQTDEVFDISIDFSDVLATAETITTKEVIAYLGSTDKTIDVITSSAISGKTIVIKVKNGKNKRSYQIIVKIETSENNVFEENITMDVWNV